MNASQENGRALKGLIMTRIIRLSIMVLSVLILGMAGCGDENKEQPQSDKYSYLDYKTMAEEQLDLPIGVGVTIGDTPNGGVFSVAFFTDASGEPVSKDEAMYIEIHECDEKGNSIYRTYMKRE